jgi:mRNA interferase RelE/StbE
MYKIQLAEKTKRQLRKLAKTSELHDLNEIFVDLKEFPYIGKPLQDEYQGCYSYRIEIYRIIYIVDEDDKIVKIIKVGHRSTVYQQ